MIEEYREHMINQRKLLDRIPPAPGEVPLIALCLCGGTIWSKVDRRGIRTGESGMFDVSDKIGEKLGAYTSKLDSLESQIYDGPSENYNPDILKGICDNVIGAINTKRKSNHFLIFAGSDMAESLALYLQNEIGLELAEKSIKLIIVWANKPAEMEGSDAWLNIESALAAGDRKDLNGDVYLVSGRNLIPAHRARKKTAFGTPMNHPMEFYDIYDPPAVTLETEKRNKIAGIANSLAIRLSGKTLLDQIERIHDHKAMRVSIQGVGKTSLIGMVYNLQDVKMGQYLWDLATSPEFIPIDPTGKIVTIPVNQPVFAPTPDELYEQLRHASAVIFKLNHSLTTSQSMAESIALTCKRRTIENRPLMALAITENDEYRSFDPSMGIYPSAQLLHQYVLPIPGAFLPTVIKLNIALNDLGYKPGPALVDFMLRNIAGEIERSILYYPDVRLIKKTYSTK